MKILCVCGARPNFMKIAPLVRAFGARPGWRPFLVHTGQHYDAAMSQTFFDELQIPRPDINLEVGSGSHAAQTAAIMQRFEPVLLAERPDAVLVVGDVNSTIACGLVAAKLCVPLVHVEAGLRSGDRTMPEEINRVLTDAISDLLFVTEPAGVENLRREGLADDKIHLVGNVMIDTLRAHLDLAQRSTILKSLGLGRGAYAVCTLHRPANVDRPDVLAGLVDALVAIAREMPVVFPVHPRTREQLAQCGQLERLAATSTCKLLDPLGYLDFLKLMSAAAVVLTDSGGMQEETTVLGVPCLTLRENTERPITLLHGTNQLVGMQPTAILAGFERVRTGRITPRIPDLWDGRAAERIAEVLARWHAS